METHINNSSSTYKNDRRVGKLLRALIAMLVTTIVAVMLTAAPADASVGTKYVEIETVNDSCSAGENGCPPGVGEGNANTVYVRQSYVDFEWVFDTVEGASDDPGNIWVKLNYDAGCRTGYKIIDAAVGNTAEEGSGFNNNNVFEAGPNVFLEFFDAPKAKNFETTLDLHVPADKVLQSNFWVAGYSSSTEFILAEAEQHIADVVAGGMSEADARAMTTSYTIERTWHGLVACKGVVFGSEYYQETPATVEFRIVFEGTEPPAPVGDGPQAGDLEHEASVNQAVMSVSPDATDGCVVHANGTFVTSQPTTIEYYVVNRFGEKSDLHSVAVDQTLVAHVSHEMAVRTSTTPITDAGNGHGDPIEDYAPESTFLVNDVFHFEIVEPHALLSNAEGYSLPPCAPGHDIDSPGDKAIDIPNNTANVELPNTTSDIKLPNNEASNVHVRTSGRGFR